MGGISHLLQKMSILRSEKGTLAMCFKGVLFDVVGNLLNDKQFSKQNAHVCMRVHTDTRVLRFLSSS